MNNSEKQKTVIVFSTYYNSPIGEAIGEDWLFNAKSTESMPMTGSLLCNHLWESIVNDKNNGPDLLKIIWDQYLIDESKNELAERIEELQKNYLTQLHKNIKDYIKDKPSVASYFQGDLEEIDFASYPLWKAKKISESCKDKETSQSFEEILHEYKVNSSNAPIEVLKKQSGSWVSQHLRKEGQQDAYEIKFPSNFNPSSRELADKPLMSYRFSYYRLRGCSDDNTMVYAIWPLDTPADDAEWWINALSEQFSKDTEQLYLILHAKDIDPRIVFDVAPPDKYGNTNRYVALFQHSGHIGDFLKKEHSIKEVYDFVVDNVRNYYYLREALKHLKHYDFDNMQKSCNFLSDEYENVKKLANDFSDNTENIRSMKELITKALNNPKKF